MSKNIAIQDKTKESLDLARSYPKESYDAIINRLIEEVRLLQEQNKSLGET